MRAWLSRTGIVWGLILAVLLVPQAGWAQEGLRSSDEDTPARSNVQAPLQHDRSQGHPVSPIRWSTRQIDETTTLEPDVPVEEDCQPSDGSIQFEGESREGRLCATQYAIDVSSSAEGIAFVLDKPAKDVDLILALSRNTPLNQALEEGQEVFISRRQSDAFRKLEWAACFKPDCDPQGTWYIGVINFTPSPQTYTLAPSITPVPLTSEQSHRGTIYPASEEGTSLTIANYTIDVPQGANRLRLELESLTGGNIDLAVRHGAPVGVEEDNIVRDHLANSVEGVEVLTIDAESEPQLRSGTYYMKVLNQDPEWRNFVITATIKGTNGERLKIKPNQFEFSAEAGAANPAPQDLQLESSTGQALNWALSVSTTPSGWLSIAGARNGITPSTLPVFVNIEDLRAGTYEGQITITSEGAANSPVRVPVELTITEPEVPPSPLEVDPAELDFEAMVGEANPSPRELQLTNTQSPSVEWRASTDASWITLSPSEGTLAPQATATLEVSIDIADLPEGVHEGRITVETPNAQSVTIPVRLTLEAPAAGEGQRVVLKFVELEFVNGGNWDESVQEGCVIYTNVTEEPALLRVYPPNGDTREFEVPAGNRVIICGDVVHIDMRT